MARWLAALAAAVLCASCSAQLAWPQENARRCTWTVAHGMKGFLCSSMDLKEVPTHLSSSIELLDLSSNRIRALTADSLSRYCYLRFLYLNDNLIVSVDDGSFDALRHLEAVDLSLNALHRVPPSLLRLPALRRLYFDDNLLGLTATTGLDEQPSSSSELQFLSLARCGLASLPPLQGFRKLQTLNVSGNSLANVTVGQIAPLCRLEVLDLVGNAQLFSQAGQLCACASLDEWLEDKGIQLARGFHLHCERLANGDYVPGERPQVCRVDGQALPSEQLDYQSCQQQLLTLERTARAVKAWSTAGICAGVIAGVVLLALLVWLRCRRRRRRARSAVEDVRNHNLRNHNLRNQKPLLLPPAAPSTSATDGDPPPGVAELRRDSAGS